MRKTFQELFGDSKAIIGLIYLAGDSQVKKTDQALEELEILEKEGFDGAIIENYHVENTEHIPWILKSIIGANFTLGLGINILGESWESFYLAEDLGLNFILIDSINPADFSSRRLDGFRDNIYNNISVLGGINFRSSTYVNGEELRTALRMAMPRCEAIVTAGQGTGIETHMRNLKELRETVEDFPLISGSGVNKDNANAVSKMVDGIIVGGYLRDGDTAQKVIRERCREIVGEFKR